MKLEMRQNLKESDVRKPLCLTSQTAKEIRLNGRSHHMISGAFHLTKIPI